MDLKHTEDFYIKALLNKVKLKEIMTSNVITILENERFSAVEEKMRVFGIRHLPVVDENNKLTGIITQLDLYQIQSPRRLEDGSWFYDQKSLDSHILKHVMTQKTYSLGPEDTVAQAIMLMVIDLLSTNENVKSPASVGNAGWRFDIGMEKVNNKKCGCVPVVAKDQSISGIVTRHDIIKIAAQILRE